MGDATQAAIAAGQINMRAMDDLSSMVKFTLTNAANERKYQSDLMRDMVQSAQNFRAQEMDEFFKRKQLVLDEKKLNLDAQYKNIGYGLDVSRINIAQQEANTNEKRVNAIIEKQERAKVNKQLFDTLAKEVVDKENKYKQDKTNLDLEIESLESNIYGRKASASGPEIKGMDAFDLFKDKKDPAGRFNKLESLKKSYPKMLDEKQLEIERIRNEMRHISEGGDPGIFYQPRTSASLPNSGSQTFTSNNTSVGGGPGLLPMPGWELSGDKHTQDEKAAQVLRNEEIGRLEGQLPQDIYQAPLSEDTEQKEKDEYDRELLSQAFNPSVPVEVAKKFINELSPKAKADVDKVRSQTESTLLLNVGTVRGFDPTQPYDTEKNPAYAALSERIFRSGGTVDDIVRLQYESDAKLSEFYLAATEKVKGNESLDSDVGRKLETQKMYSEWVLSRNQEKVKAAENQVEAAIKLGPLSKDSIVISSKDKNLGSFDDLKKSFAEDPSLILKKKEEERLLKLENEFKGFYEKDGTFNKKSFFNSAKGTKLGGMITGYSGMNTPISDDPYVSETPERELYNKISKMTDKEAKKYWMEYKNYKPSIAFKGAFGNFNN
jgi:hypothetical protein